MEKYLLKKYIEILIIIILILTIFSNFMTIYLVNAKSLKVSQSQEVEEKLLPINMNRLPIFRWNQRKITIKYDMVVTNADNKTVNITTYLAKPDSHIYQDIHGDIIYTPNPDGFLMDRFGQEVAFYKYKLLPDQNISFLWQVNATIYSIRYIILPWKIKGEIPEEIIEKYTTDEPYYKINDPFIQKIVKNEVGNTKNILYKILKLHNYVIKNLEYVHDDKWDDAVTVLKRGNGSCSEYCFAFIALCRAAGIPARYNGGSIYNKEPPHIDTIYHRIVEIYIPNYEWIPIDVTWDDYIFKYYYFGLHINKLFTLTTGGGSSEYLNWSYHYWQEVIPPSDNIIVNKSITWLQWERPRSTYFRHLYDY